MCPLDKDCLGKHWVSTHFQGFSSVTLNSSVMFYNGYYHPSPEPFLFYKAETLHLLSTGPLPVGWLWFPTLLSSLTSHGALCRRGQGV